MAEDGAASLGEDVVRGKSGGMVLGAEGSLAGTAERRGSHLVEWAFPGDLVGRKMFRK